MAELLQPQTRRVVYFRAWEGDRIPYTGHTCDVIRRKHANCETHTDDQLPSRCIRNSDLQKTFGILTMCGGKFAAEQRFELCRREVPVSVGKVTHSSHDEDRQTFRHADEQLTVPLSAKLMWRVSCGEKFSDISVGEAGDIAVDPAERLFSRRR